MPVVLTEHGTISYDGTTAAPFSQSPASNPTDPVEQRNDYEALLRSADGRALTAIADGRRQSVFLWHWGMPGSTGSLWYLDPEGDPVIEGATAAQFVVDFVATAASPVPVGGVVLVVLAGAVAAVARRAQAPR